mgnify:CR=1 FL=1|tara:strand:+ start:140 stop:835 length:696 start_codon:yes stop_codon:yes gene_type:complete
MAPDIASLKAALKYIDAHPDKLHTAELGFFKEWLVARGCALTTEHLDTDDEDEPPPDVEGADDAMRLARAATGAERVDHYTRAIELDPSCSRRLVERGEACFGSGDYDAAKADADKALKLKADSVKGLRLRAKVAWMQRDVKSAYYTLGEAQTIDYSDEYDSLHRQMKDALENEDKETTASSSSCTPTPRLSGDDMNAFMQSPAVQEMTQNLMRNPALMQQMMSGFNRGPA